MRSLTVRTLAGLCALGLVVGGIFAILLANVHDQAVTSHDARAVDSQVANAVEVQKLLVDMETGLRGYELTGRRSFLAPYSAALHALPPHASQLRAFARTNPADRRPVDAILTAIASYERGYAAPLASAPPIREPHHLAAVTLEGKERMDHLRAQLNGFISAHLEQSRSASNSASDRSTRSMLFAAAGLAITLLLMLLFGSYALRAVLAPMRRVAVAARRLAAGDLSARVLERGSGEVADLAESFNLMATSLQFTRDELERQNAELEAQHVELEMAVEDLGEEKARVERFYTFGSRLAEETELKPLAETILQELGDVAHAQVGVLYVAAGTFDEALLMASRGVVHERLPAQLRAGEGLVGRALAERRAVGASYGQVGLTVPAFGVDLALLHEVHVPLLHGDRVVGVATLGRMEDVPFAPGEIQSVEYLADRAAVAIANAISLLVARDQAAINHAVLETSADGFISIDSNGMISQWNPKAEEIFGWGSFEAVGRRLSDLIIPEPNRERHERALAEFVRTGEGWPFEGAIELTALHRAGNELSIEATITPLRLGESWQFNAFIRDISDRKRAEQHAEAHHRVTRVLSQAADVAEARVGILSALGETTGWDWGATWQFDAASGHLRRSSTWAAEGFEAPAMEAATRELALVPGENALATVWDGGAPAWIRDAAAEQSFVRREVAAADGLHGHVSFPVFHGDELIGVTELFSRDRRERDDELMTALARLGPQIGDFVARKRAESEAERLKDEFFALVSHELRTPLTSIIGYLELVLEERDRLDQETGHFLDIVERNGRRLLRLVDDLLFVVQVEAGNLTLEPGVVELSTVVAESVEAARPRARERGIELDLDAARLPASGGDAGRLAQAVDNLVSNAIKFTPGGGRVEVTLARRDGLAMIAVRDTGVGIADSEQALLFDRFFRSESARSAAIPGVGLGLTIVKAIVEGHGGSIDVESEPGAGTTFRVLLPMREPGALPLARTNFPSSVEVSR